MKKPITSSVSPVMNTFDSFLLLMNITLRRPASIILWLLFASYMQEANASSNLRRLSPASDNEKNPALYYFLIIGMPILGSVISGLLVNWIWSHYKNDYRNHAQIDQNANFPIAIPVTPITAAASSATQYCQVSSRNELPSAPVEGSSKNLSAPMSVASAVSSPPLFNHAIGTLELKVTQNKLRLVIKLESGISNLRQLEKYFERSLPHSRVAIGAGHSYSMDSSSFGRCWKISGGNNFELDLWFPPTHLKTFNNKDLDKLLQEFSEILALPQQAVDEIQPPPQIISTIPIKEYIPAMNSPIYSMKQIENCCNSFLSYSKKIAEKRGFSVKDEVIDHSKRARPSNTASNIGFFGVHEHYSSTSPTSSSQYRSPVQSSQRL